jgi:DNA-binding protein HU-beta
VNRSQLVDELAERFGGNRKVAAHALDSVVDVITRSVAAGEKVVITGFGAFERTVRKAGTARNPRTGDAVTTPKKFVARFRPGNEFKDVVSGARKAQKRVADSLAVVPATAASAAESATRAAASGLRAAAGAARSASGGRSAATKATAGSRTTTKKATMPAKKTTAKKTTAKKTTAKKTTAKKTATKKAAAKAAPVTAG